MPEIHRMTDHTGSSDEVLIRRSTRGLAAVGSSSGSSSFFFQRSQTWVLIFLNLFYFFTRWPFKLGELCRCVSCSLKRSHLFYIFLLSAGVCRLIGSDWCWWTLRGDERGGRGWRWPKWVSFKARNCPECRKKEWKTRGLHFGSDVLTRRTTCSGCCTCL